MNDRITRIEAADHLLEKATAANVDREGLAETLGRDWADMSQLIAYYQGEWRNDLEALPDAAYGVLSEDGIWNEMGTFYDQIREIHETTSRIIADYERCGRGE